MAEDASDTPIDFPDCGREMSPGWVGFWSSERLWVEWSEAKPMPGWLGTSFPLATTILSSLCSRLVRQGFRCTACNNLLIRLKVEPEKPE